MLLTEVFSTTSTDYAEWQNACRSANGNVTFSGDEAIGSEAIDTISAGNPVVGVWDGKTHKGTVYSDVRKRRKEYEK